MAVARSFKSKLILSYVFVILASFAFLAFFLDKNLEENSIRNIEASLVNQARLVENQVTPDAVRREDIPRLERLVTSLGRKVKCRITIINTSGKVLADSGKPQEEVAGMENHLYRPEVKAALAGGIGIDMRYSSTLKIDMLYVALPIRDDSNMIGITRLALPLESVRKTLAQTRRTVLMGLLFALALAFVLGSVVARGAVKPINKMIQVSRKFSEGDFTRRIIHGPKDEIGDLADTLNRMAQDIEDKIREIETQNQKLAAIFNSMVEGIIVVGRDSRIISVNPTIEKIFGVVKKDAEGKNLLETIRNSGISEVISAVLKKGEGESAELALVYPVRGIFEVSATPIFENNEIMGCVAVIHDVTELRRLETIRSDFIANASHELKTPLTSIKGFVETLLEGAMDDKDNSRSFLAIIQEHAERLNNLVNDLLSLSHLESKEIVLRKKDVDLAVLVKGIVAGFKSQLNKKGIEARNELIPGISIEADEDRVEQVFTNLIDNAIKFNKDKGLIRIYSQDAGDKVKVVIEDSGIGIPGKDIPRIFERFYRVDKARSRELGGTGLGLSIVKHVVELHQGAVGVESVEGLGSKFWLTLPKSR